MLRKIRALYRGHLDTCRRYGVRPSITAILRQVFYNITRFKVVVDKNNCYVVYEIVHRYHIDKHAILINAVYCPKKYRKKGNISKLYDKIAKKHNMVIILFNKSDRYEKIGEIYLRR